MVLGFRRKHEEPRGKMSLGGNMPQITQAEMQKVKIWRADLSKTGINLIMRELKPRTDDWEDWHAFKGICEEALHFLCLHVVTTLKRDEKKMCGFRKVNLRLQETRSEQREKFFATKDIQRRLLKVKSELKQFDEYREKSPAARRKQVKIIAELDHFLKLISPEARRDVFKEKSNEKISEELNSREEHWTRVTDWLDARNTDEIARRFTGVEPRLQALKIQEKHRTSNNAAMIRYVNKRESPPCSIDDLEIYKYWLQAWGKRKDPSLTQNQTHRSTCAVSCQMNMYRKR
jgi:hypothetical protein